MNRNYFKNPTIYGIIVTLSLVLGCAEIPTDPYQSPNTTIHLVMQKSPTLTMLNESTFIDTLGAQIRIGIASNLTKNIDSASLTIISEDTTPDTAAFHVFGNLNTKDTVWISRIARDTGKKTLCAEAYIHGWKTLKDTVFLTIYARTNHPPRISVSGVTSIAAGGLCSLSVVASDPDAGQKLRYAIYTVPVNSLFDTAAGIFKWTPGIADTGTDTIVFRVVDDGLPPMTDSQKVVVTVVPSKANHAPKWQNNSINENANPGAARALTLSTMCSDPDGDSLSFMLLDGAPARDTLYNAIYSWTPLTQDTGTYSVRIVAVDPLGLTDTLTIHFTVASVVPTNHRPLLSIEGARNVKSGTTCILTAKATDIDSNQTLTYSVVRKPAGSAFDTGSHVFSWATPAGFKGTDTAIFIIADNGVPPMSDTQKVTILISDSVVNHPPKWESDSIALNASVGAALNLTLTTICSDPDGDKISFSLIAGKPGADTIKNGVYSFTPTAADTGSFMPRIIAKDSTGLMDTLLIKLIVTVGDRKAPLIRLSSPASDSATVGASTVAIKVICTDSSGVASVKCSMGADTFAVSNADSTFSATVSGLKSTGTNEILFIATDKAANANRDTLKVHIKYDNDSIKPVISRFDPAQDSTSISANSYMVKVLCKDASGIATLACSMGTTAIATTKINDSLWSANIGGLTQNQFNKITFIATDAALKANKDTLIIYLKYDPTMEDMVAPIIVQISSLPGSMVVSDSIISITDSLYDQSGIDSVYWTLNGKNKRLMVPVAAIATGGTYKMIDTLRRYHFDTIDVYAQDKSTARNRGSQKIIVNYNVSPVAHDTTVSTAYNTAKTISMTAASIDGDVLTWSALGDPGHGTVAMTASNVTYTPTSGWAGLDSFFVKVSDGVWNDTAKVRVTTTIAAPTGLSYSANPATYWTNAVIAPNTATVTGIVDSFTVSPSLPSGLAIAKQTGVITGTPTAASVTNNYTVTAKNRAGTATVTLAITVNGPPGAAPTLVSPKSDSNGVPTSTTLTWNAVTGTVTGYTLQVANNSAFTSPLINETVTSGTSKAVTILNSSTRYYWKVCAVNQGGPGPWKVDSFTTFIIWAIKNYQLSDLSINCIAATGGNVYIGTSSGVYLSSNNGDSWARFTNGPTNVSKIAANGAIVVATGSGGAFRSNDNGGNWSLVLSTDTIASFYDLAINGTTVYAATSNDVYFSDDAGTNWNHPVNNGLPNHDIMCLTVNSSDELWGGGSNSGNVFYSSNKGGYWNIKTTTSAFLFSIASINNVVYAADYGSGIFITRDKGSTWESSEGSDTKVSSIAGNGNKVVIASPYGVRFSQNSGKSWASTDNLGATAEVVAISGNYIFIGTLSDGVRRSPLP